MASVENSVLRTFGHWITLIVYELESVGVYDMEGILLHCLLLEGNGMMTQHNV